MREIKFRAWEVDTSTMFYNIQEPLVESPQEAWEFHDFLNNEAYRVMQYTGLKDKNGQEIYEGDVIAFTEIAGEKIWQQGVGAVTFGEFETSGDGQGYGNDTVIGFYIADAKVTKAAYDDYIGLTDNISLANWEELEVIGNIYENPELLEASDAKS